VYQIREGKYKDASAVILENDSLRVTITPDFGARTASIIYKPQNRELLWQNPDPTHARAGYGTEYEEGEFAGFDEMFPTISRCYYEDGPWAGTEMPDHGEVWTLPWEYSIAGDGESVTFSVFGVRFPYRFSKTVSLAGPEGAVLHGAYSAENLSPYPFDCIWAAHPLFNTHPGMRFIVPEGMDRIVNAVPGKTLGAYGRELDFPRAERGAGKGGGEMYDLSLVPEKNGEGYQKYYFTGKVTEGWCLLYSPEWELSIALSYPKETVSCLGMWLNEGGYAGQYNIAPEPATGGMDRVDFAKMWGTGSVLPENGRLSWYLDITVTPGAYISKNSPRFRGSSTFF
jgi:hypothetical protein